MNREEKAAKVKELEEVLQSAKGVYLADFRGMTVETISELRKRCRESSVRLEVVKNTLLRRAAHTAGADGIIEFTHGPTAVATSTLDEVAPARVLMDFFRERKSPEVKAGLVNGRALSSQSVRDVAALPGREVLLGNLLRALQGPLSKFVGVLRAPVRDLANVLDQVAKQKGSAA